LGLGDELLQSVQSVGIEFAFVGEHIIEPNAAVRADLRRLA